MTWNLERNDRTRRKLRRPDRQVRRDIPKYFSDRIITDNRYWRIIMHAAKQEALETIDKLPEDTDMDEIMYRLYVVDKIRKGQEAVEQDHTLTSEELKREIDSW